MRPSPHYKVIDTPGSTYWFDDSGILNAVIKNAPDAGADHRKMLLGDFKKSLCGKKICLIVDVSSGSTIEKDSRDLNAREYPELFKAIAFVTTSPLGAMLAHVYLGLKPSALPCRIFSNEKEAREWIVNYL